MGVDKGPVRCYTGVTVLQLAYLIGLFVSTKMSALLHIKNLIIARLECEPELKNAIMGVMNAIDSDLDEGGYETSFETDECIAALDAVLTGYDEDEEDEIIDAEVEDANTDALLEDLEKEHDVEEDDDDDDDDEK